MSGFFLEVDLSIDKLFFVSINLSFQVGDCFLHSFVLSLQLVPFFGFKFQDYSAFIVGFVVFHKILLESLVLVAEVDHIKAEVLVVFLQGFYFSLLIYVVSFQSYELYLQVPLRFKSLVQRNVQL